MEGLLEKYGVLQKNPDTNEVEISEKTFKEFLKKVGTVCRTNETDLPVALGGRNTEMDYYSRLLDLENSVRFKDFQQIMRERLTKMATCINDTQFFGINSNPSPDPPPAPTADDIAKIKNEIGLIDTTAIDRYFGLSDIKPVPIEAPTDVVKKATTQLQADAIQLQTIMNSAAPLVAAQGYINTKGLKCNAAQLLTGIALLIQGRQLNISPAIKTTRDSLEKEQAEQKKITNNSTPEKYKQDKKYIDLQEKIEKDEANLNKLNKLNEAITKNENEDTIFKFMKNIVDQTSQRNPDITDTLEEFVFERAVDLVFEEYLTKWLGLAKTSMYHGYGDAASAYATNTVMDGGLEIVPSTSPNVPEDNAKKSFALEYRNASSYSANSNSSIRSAALGQIGALLGDWASTIEKNFDRKDYPIPTPNKGTIRGQVYVLKQGLSSKLKAKIEGKTGSAVELDCVITDGYPSYKPQSVNSDSVKESQYDRFKQVYTDSWISDDDRAAGIKTKIKNQNSQLYAQGGVDDQKQEKWWHWEPNSNNSSNSSAAPDQFDPLLISGVGVSGATPSYQSSGNGTWIFNNEEWKAHSNALASAEHSNDVKIDEEIKNTPSSQTGCGLLPAWMIRMLFGLGAYNYKATYPPGTPGAGKPFSIAGGGDARAWGLAYDCWVDATTDGISTDPSATNDADGKDSARDSLAFEPPNDLANCRGRRPLPGDIIYMATTENHSEIHHAAICVDGLLDGLFCDADGNPLMITADAGAGSMKNSLPVKIVYYARWMNKQAFYSLTPFLNQDDTDQQYLDDHANHLNDGFVSASPSTNDPEWNKGFTRTFVGWCNLDTINTIIK